MKKDYQKTSYEIEKENLYDISNKTIQELMDRKSVRVFEDRPVSDNDKKMILYAASEAPTAGCQQLYTILDIVDQELKEKLAVTCDHQPFIAKAPMVLVFCADCRKWLKAYIEAGCEPRKPGTGDLMLAVTDAAIAAQNAVTAAWSLGIGSCYIGDIMEQYEEQRKILNLPEYVFPAVMVVFGFPVPQQKTRMKPVRFELEDVVCENVYHEKDGNEIRKMFHNRSENQDYEKWMERFCNRKYNSDFAKEMTRSVSLYLEQFL